MVWVGEPHLLEVVVSEEQVHQSAKEGRNLVQCNEGVQRLSTGCHRKRRWHKLILSFGFSSAPLFKETPRSNTFFQILDYLGFFCFKTSSHMFMLAGRLTCSISEK